MQSAEDIHETPRRSSGETCDAEAASEAKRQRKLAKRRRREQRRKRREARALATDGCSGEDTAQQLGDVGKALTGKVSRGAQTVQEATAAGGSTQAADRAMQRPDQSRNLEPAGTAEHRAQSSAAVLDSEAQTRGGVRLRPDRSCSRVPQIPGQSVGCLHPRHGHGQNDAKSHM